MAKGIYKPLSQDGCELWVRDFEDILFDTHYAKQKFMGIIRQSDSSSLSLVLYMNIFFENNGFRSIVNRIKNRENWLSPEMLQHYVNGFGNVQALLSK